MTSQAPGRTESQRPRSSRLLAPMVALVLAASAIVACAELRLDESEGGPVFTGPDGENTPILCSDGIDNDGDGFTDCADPQCVDTGVAGDEGCEEAPCPGRVVCLTTENTDKQCSDGVDNDGNGFVDCQDFGCLSALSCCVPRVPAGGEASDELCSDGIDNDCNGYADCGDFSCSRGAQVTVCCTKTVESEDTNELCGNGLDDDCDGFPDCDDFSCSRDTPSVDICAVAIEAEPEDDDAACSDGFDNDRDGYVDCADFDCADPAKARSLWPEYCREAQPEVDAAECSDGVDNDRDGFADCADFRCLTGHPDLCQE